MAIRNTGHLINYLFFLYIIFETIICGLTEMGIPFQLIPISVLNQYLINLWNNGVN